MGVTLDELLRRFRAGLSEGDTEFFTDQNALDWLNEGQNEVFIDSPFTTQGTWELDQFSVPVNGFAFVVPDACGIPTGAATALVGGGVVRLNYVEPDRLDRMMNGSVIASGQPAFVSYRVVDDGTAMIVWPRPAVQATLFLEGFKVPKRLTTETSMTDLPEHLVAPVILYALWCAKGKDEESAQAREAERKFVGAMNKIAERRMQYQADQHNTVRYRRAVAGWPFFQGRVL